MMFVNIHTHHMKGLDIEVIASQGINNNHSGYFTIGLHPWDINQDSEKILQLIFEKWKNESFWGYGEIGLDRRCAIDMDLQKRFLIDQLKFIKEEKIPRVILHNVRATFDLLPLIGGIPSIFIWHGFRDNILSAQQILNQTNSYFSFGSALISSNRAKETFKQLPIDRIFLETDDNDDITIDDVYQMASAIKGLTLIDLQKCLYENWLKVN